MMQVKQPRTNNNNKDYLFQQACFFLAYHLSALELPSYIHVFYIKAS